VVNRSLMSIVAPSVGAGGESRRVRGPLFEALLSDGPYGGGAGEEPGRLALSTSRL
jgi:hypothetical protein